MSEDDIRIAGLPVVRFFGEVSSTFDVARDLACRLHEWDSVFARSQTSGRGQMRRRWDSPSGNLYATIRLPKLPPFTLDAAAVAFATLCAEALASLDCPVALKWPNDLVVENRGGPAKVGGILLEDRDDCLLAGIGLNINHAPADIRDDAALPAANLVFRGKKLGPAELWLALARYLREKFNHDKGLAQSWPERANALLLWRGKPVSIQDGESRADGILAGIAENGGAMLDQARKRQVFISGSLSLNRK